MKAEATTSLKMLLAGAGAAAALAVSLTGCASAGSSSPSSSKTTKPHMQTAAFTIVALPNGGERVSPGGNVAVAPGVPVRVTVTNLTREFHTFTIPGLNVSRLISPAHGGTPTKTTFTFTPTKRGSLAWLCAICQGGGHGHPHAMGGTIWVVIDPSVIP